MPRAARKIIHASVFTGAAVVYLLRGFWGVVLYGSVLSLLISVGVALGPGFFIHDWLARQEDGDARVRSVMVPLVATALGGLLSTLLVGDYAVVGFLACGWGDAVGEPAGKRWGRHWYAPPLRSPEVKKRSVEGSLAVFAAGAFGAMVALLILGAPPIGAVGVGLLCGGAAAVAEGSSGPRTDNLWVQVIPSVLAWWLLG